MESDVYLLGRSQVEEERLLKQVQDLAGEARWLLNRLQIRPGTRALDLCCGPQGVLEMLSERVGPKGSVVGLEKSDNFFESARKFVAEKGFANVEIAQGDARATHLPRESFDVVFCRLVLVNVPDPEEIVREMVALTRPGGVVASHEGDYLPHLCDPPSPAWNRLFEILETYSRARGVDLFVGRKAHRMLREAGLVDIQVNPVIHVYPPGHNRRTILLDFIQNIRAGAVAEGLVGKRELDDLMAELRPFRVRQ